MYTELVFAAKIKKDTPSEVIKVLDYMAGNKENCPEKLPNHPFFETERWSILFTCSSYYFNGWAKPIFEYDDIGNEYSLTTWANLKNYDDEISKFIDWIMPYLNVFEDEFLGYSRYEQDDKPTLIYAKIR